MNQDTLLVITLVLVITTFLIIAMPITYRLIREFFKKTKYSSMGESSKIRLVRQLYDAVEVMSKEKTGAIITIENKDDLENYRTDGIIIDSNISSQLIIAIFNKNSPIHDGAIIIDKNKITYAGTYYKITSKSVDNKFGARHRAAMGISDQTDALTIVVSEETGGVSFTKNSELIKVKINEFQEKLTQYLV